MEEVKDYSPFNQVEFESMAADLESVGAYLPEDKLNIFWERCTRIRGKGEPLPCSCGSAGPLWGKCVEDIRNFVNARK